MTSHTVENGNENKDTTMASPTEPQATPSQKLVFNQVHGPIFGDVTENSVIIWYRDENGLQDPPILKYWQSNDDPSILINVSTLQLNPVDPDADFTCKTLLKGLNKATHYTYVIGDDIIGSFKTSGSASLSFVFGSCIGGQGFGRLPADHPIGEGFPIFKAMTKLEPDFVQIQGDFIYADNAIHKVDPSPFFKGQRFQTPNDVDVLEVANDIEGFRNRYKYTLEDEHLCDFLRNTVVYNTWDDHEIFDDFGKERLHHQGNSELYKCGEQVFYEYWPLAKGQQIYRSAEFGPHAHLMILDTRSYRATHRVTVLGETPAMAYMLGQDQKRWLLDELKDSTKTWKFIATSVPLAYPTGWPRPEETGYDGWSDGNDVSMSGPELELQEILMFIHSEKIKNVIFLSGDVHFPFAISYDPYETGEPLIYEIGSTPFHALCLPPPEKGPDKSFIPTTLYAEGKFADQSNLNFGHVLIDDDANFTFHIRDVNGESKYELNLTPK